MCLVVVRVCVFGVYKCVCAFVCDVCDVVFCARLCLCACVDMFI